MGLEQQALGRNLLNNSIHLNTEFAIHNTNFMIMSKRLALSTPQFSYLLNGNQNLTDLSCRPDVRIKLI